VDADNLYLGQKLKMPGAGDDEPDEKPKKSAKEPKEKAMPKGSNYYAVKNGDNLSNIAKRQHISVAQLKKLNKDIDADDLHLGQKLRIK
jgi:membrane-bound lytic murein transglycosylase D